MVTACSRRVGATYGQTATLSFEVPVLIGLVTVALELRDRFFPARPPSSKA